MLFIPDVCYTSKTLLYLDIKGPRYENVMYSF